MNTRQAIGKSARDTGKLCEKLFELWCNKNKHQFIKIEDGAFQTKNKVFIRKNQICDYILLQKNKDDKIECFFVDVKTKPKRLGITKLPKSFFYQGNRRIPTSTHKQVQRMRELYMFGWPNAGFHFIEPENNEHYWIAIGNILHCHFSLMPLEGGLYYGMKEST